MKRKRKPITRAVIKRHFGKDAKVYGFAGHYRVVTASGGEVSFSQRKVKTIYGGEDVYRAVVLLAGECWGGLTVKGGSREFMLASMAHGEALGVPVRPNFEERGEVVARWFGALLALIVTYGTLLSHTGDPVIAVLARVWRRSRFLCPCAAIQNARRKGSLKRAVFCIRAKPRVPDMRMRNNSAKVGLI